MSLDDAVALCDQGRFREACAILEAVIAAGGADAAIASAYLVGWSVHVPEVAASRRAKLAANANGHARGLLALEMVTRTGWVGRMSGAAALLERSLPQLSLALPAPRRARMFGYGAMLELARGDVERADEHARRAAALAERVGDRRWSAFSEAAHGLIALERGDLESARARLTRAAKLAEPIEDVMVPTTIALVVGELEMDRGHPERAARAYGEAVACCDGRHRFMAPWAWASVAAAQADAGRPEEARFAIERARRASRGLGALTTRGVELRSLHLALAEDRADARPEVERELDALRGVPELRRWRAQLARSCRARSVVIEVSADRRRIRVDGGRAHSLSRSPMQRRLLDALLVRRRAGLGPAPAKALLEDLGIETQSLRDFDRAVARVHAATVRLRRAGLGRLLLHEGDGLAIDPRAFVEQTE